MAAIMVFQQQWFCYCGMSLQGVQEVAQRCSRGRAFGDLSFRWVQSWRALQLLEAPSCPVLASGSKIWSRRISINVQWIIFTLACVPTLCRCVPYADKFSIITAILGLMCQPLLKYRKPSTASARCTVPISLFVKYRECPLVSVSSTNFHRESFKTRYLTKERTYSVVRGVNPSLVYYTPTTFLSR